MIEIQPMIECFIQSNKCESIDQWHDQWMQWFSIGLIYWRSMSWTCRNCYCYYIGTEVTWLKHNVFLEFSTKICRIQHNTNVSKSKIFGSKAPIPIHHAKIGWISRMLKNGIGINKQQENKKKIKKHSHLRGKENCSIYF